MQKHSVIFFGTPLFTIPILEAIMQDERFDVIGIVTQTAKATGRKKQIIPSPVEQYAKEHNIPYQTPQKIRDESFQNWLTEKNPDICIVVAYGKILPQKVLDIPRYGFMNVHYSLLPKYRGAAPVQYALLHGEEETGITFMIMNAKMDEGPVLSQTRYTIKLEDTSAKLLEKLSNTAARDITDIANKYIHEEIKPEPQDESKATYTKMIRKEDGQIDWQTESARQIMNKLRAFTPWPGIYTFLDGKRFKILSATRLQENSQTEPGTYIADKGIQTKKGFLMPLEVQLEGKKKVPFSDFLRGWQGGTLNFQVQHSDK